MMGEAESRLVAVMARLQPHAAFRFLAPAEDVDRVARHAAPIRDEGAAVGVVDGERRMGSGRALRQQPVAGRRLRAAIDDDALLAVIELEAEDAGMGMSVEARG